MTLALVSLAIVSAPLWDETLYVANLVAVGAMAVPYALAAQFGGGGERACRPRDVVLLWLTYAAYLGAMVVILWP